MSIAEKLQALAENEQTISNGINTETDLIQEIKNIVEQLPEAGGNGDDFNIVIAEQAEIIENIQNMVDRLTTHTEALEEGRQQAAQEHEEANQIVLDECNNALSTKGVETAETLEQVPQRIGEIESLAEAEIYFTKYGTMYRKHHVIPSEGTDGFYSYAYRYADKMETLDVPNQRAIWTNPSNIFQYCSALKKASLPKIQRVGGGFFGDCFSLEEVTLGCEEFPITDIIATAFLNCSALKRLNFIGTMSTSISFAQSPLLDAESVQTIISSLADLTGATAQTLTIHATVGAKLTQAQKDAVAAKNWTLVY